MPDTEISALSPSLNLLVSLWSDELALIDIALLNLVDACGLPEDIDLRAVVEGGRLGRRS